MKWTQLYVRAPEGHDNSPVRMRRADEIVKLFGGTFNVPQNNDGLPVAMDDGTYEVRVLGVNDLLLNSVRKALTEHESLEIVSEQIHDD